MEKWQRQFNPHIKVFFDRCLHYLQGWEDLHGKTAGIEYGSFYHRYPNIFELTIAWFCDNKKFIRKFYPETPNDVKKFFEIWLSDNWHEYAVPDFSLLV